MKCSITYYIVLVDTESCFFSRTCYVATAAYTNIVFLVYPKQAVLMSVYTDTNVSNKPIISTNMLVGL